MEDLESPLWSELAVLRGEVALQQGRLDSADDWFRGAFTNASEAPPPLRLNARVKLAFVLLERGNQLESQLVCQELNRSLEQTPIARLRVLTDLVQSMGAVFNEHQDHAVRFAKRSVVSLCHDDFFDFDVGFFAYRLQLMGTAQHMDDLVNLVAPIVSKHLEIYPRIVRVAAKI